MTSIMMIIKYTLPLSGLGVRTWCISQCHESTQDIQQQESISNEFFSISLHLDSLYFQSPRAASKRGSLSVLFQILLRIKYYTTLKLTLISPGRDRYLNCLRLNWRSMMSKDHLPKDPWSVVKIWLGKNTAKILLFTMVGYLIVS